MLPDLFFLRRPLPEQEWANGFRWTLAVVKTDDYTVPPYLGFRSATLAEMVTKSLGADYSPISVGAIDREHSADFEVRNIILFESPVVVMRFLEAPASFPYEAHLFQYSQSTGNLEAVA